MLEGIGAHKSEGRLRFRKRPSYLMAVSRILSPAPVFLASSNQLDCFSEKLGLDDDHLSHPAPVLLARCQDRHLHSQNWGWTSGEFSFAVMRRYPRINPDFGVYGRAVLPLFCLAPHGVFPASRITPRAVSSYLAFSTLPVPCIAKNRRCLFCDTFRHRNPEHFRGRGARVFYAACCRMVFGLSSGESCDSPAIICHRHAI